MLSKIKNISRSIRITPYLEVRVVGLVIFTIIILLVSWSGVKVIQTNYELEKKISQLQKRNTLKKLENENLRLKNTYYESDQYLELTARRQFNKAAPGEKLFVVPTSVALSKTVDLLSVDDANLASNSAEVQAKKSKFQQNLEDWLVFILHKNRS